MIQSPSFSILDFCIGLGIAVAGILVDFLGRLLAHSPCH